MSSIWDAIGAIATAIAAAIALWLGLKETFIQRSLRKRKNRVAKTLLSQEIDQLYQALRELGGGKTQQMVLLQYKDSESGRAGELFRQIKRALEVRQMRYVLDNEEGLSSDVELAIARVVASASLIQDQLGDGRQAIEDFVSTEDCLQAVEELKQKLDNGS